MCKCSTACIIKTIYEIKQYIYCIGPAGMTGNRQINISVCRTAATGAQGGDRWNEVAKNRQIFLVLTELRRGVNMLTSYAMRVFRIFREEWRIRADE